MRLIDADALKEKLLNIQADIANERVSRGSAISDAWKPVYLLILDEYINILDEMPSVTHHYNCNHHCDALREAYHKEFVEDYKSYKERKEEEEKEAEKINNKKAIIDKMNEEVWNEIKNCFGGIE